MKSAGCRATLKPLVLALGLVCAPVLAEEPVVATTPAAGAPAASAPVSEKNRYIIELIQKLDQLQNEIRQLRGQLEIMSNDMSGVKRRQRELYLDIDRRMRALEQRSGVASSVPATTATRTPPVAGTGTRPTVPVTTADEGVEERKAYEAAFNLLTEGRYDQAITSFKAFLKQYAKGKYAGNAQYWLGEVYYVSRKYKLAIVAFEKVIKDYPGSAKVADAMLKSGFTYYELKDWVKSRAVLQQVIQKYPSSTASTLANKRLQLLSKEGR